MSFLASAALRYGLVALLAAGIIGGIYFKGRSDGVNGERARIAAEIEQSRKDRNRVEGEVGTLPDDELFRRLCPRC